MLAVDNLSGARVGKRTIKVDHVLDYKKKKAEVGLRCIVVPPLSTCMSDSSHRSAVQYSSDRVRCWSAGSKLVVEHATPKLHALHATCSLYRQFHAMDRMHATHSTGVHR